MRWLALFLAVVGASAQRLVEGESCGADSIPYKIVVDETGKPELYCDTPSCFGDVAEAEKPGPRRKPRSSDGAATAKCSNELLETVCTGEYEWTGTLVEENNGTHRTLKTECCTYDGLSEAHELKTVLLEAGDQFSGGTIEVRAGVQAFDLVKEVRKTVTSDKRVQYVVSIHRMPCFVAEESNNADFIPYSSDFFARTKRRMDNRRRAVQRFDEEETAPAAGSRRQERRSVEDYDLPPRRRRPSFRRRLFRRPVLDDYYDYDYDYALLARPLLRRQKLRQLAMADDRLWPVAFRAPNSNMRQRVYAPQSGVGGGEYAGELLGQVEGQGQQLQGAQGEIGQPLQQLPAQTAETQGYINPVAPPPADGAVALNGQGYAQVPPATANPLASYPVPPQMNSYVQPPQYNYAPQPAYQAPAQGCGGSTCGGNFGNGGNGLNGVFDQMQCFSGDMEVETPAGKKFIKDLKVGDHVLSIEENLISFSPIIMFLHRSEDEPAEFVQIKTKTGRSLKLTEQHLIYKSDCNTPGSLALVKAKEVTVGSCIHTLANAAKSSLRSDRVVEIEMVRDSGIYAPLTVTGDIVVNDVLASCHSNLGIKTLQQSFFSIYRTFGRWMGKSSSAAPEMDMNSIEGDLPMGVSYLTTVIDLFLPKYFFN